MELDLALRERAVAAAYEVADAAGGEPFAGRAAAEEWQQGVPMRASGPSTTRAAGLQAISAPSAPSTSAAAGSASNAARQGTPAGSLVGSLRTNISVCCTAVFTRILRLPGALMTALPHAGEEESQPAAHHPTEHLSNGGALTLS